MIFFQDGCLTKGHWYVMNLLRCEVDFNIVMQLGGGACSRASAQRRNTQTKLVTCETRSRVTAFKAAATETHLGGNVSGVQTTRERRKSRRIKQLLTVKNASQYCQPGAKQSKTPLVLWTHRSGNMLRLQHARVVQHRRDACTWQTHTPNDVHNWPVKFYTNVNPQHWCLWQFTGTHLVT